MSEIQKKWMDKIEMRALKEGWPIPADRKIAVMDNMLRIADGSHPNSDPRTSVQAFSAIVAAQKLAAQPQQNLQINIHKGGSGPQEPDIGDEDVSRLIDDLAEPG